MPFSLLWNLIDVSVEFRKEEKLLELCEIQFDI